LIEVIIQEEIFDPKEIIAKIRSRIVAGAMVSFIGSVREYSDDKLQFMEIEHYDEMAKKIFLSTLNQAKAQWDLKACYLIHRYGKLYPNEPIVMVVTCSDHRKESYKANHFVVDYLKTKAPFWKKEHFKKYSKWVKQTV
jgi:molybdopterin synthase catalytic subunit